MPFSDRLLRGQGLYSLCPPPTASSEDCAAWEISWGFSGLCSARPRVLEVQALLFADLLRTTCVQSPSAFSNASLASV